MLDPMKAAKAGFALVIQDTRGRYTSGGEFYCFVDEINDGYDTVEWAASLPWSSGKVGMIGASYVGATQWLCATSQPPHLAAIAPNVTASNYHDGWPRRSGAILQWQRYCRAVDQGRQVRPELDSAVVPSVRGQPGETVSVHSGVQPWELPSPVMSAQGGQALVAAERAGQADQDGMPSGAALPAINLSVVRSVGSSKVVPGSVGSYRPVIAGAKLREGTTTILPRGRALQGVGLSSMRFHPIGGGPKTTKMDKNHGSRQESHPLLDRPEIDWPCRTRI